MSELNVVLPTKQQFLSALDSTFSVDAGNLPGFEMQLLRCDEIVSNEVQENFTLLFRAPSEAPPFQGIFRLTHDALGEMDVFLVPVKRDENGLYYEAVFNHLLEKNLAI